MNTRSRSAHARIATRNNRRYFHPAPLAHAVALIIATGAWHSAHAQQAFSSAWFAAKGAAQSTAASTGYLPNGMPASSLTNPALQQQKANQQLQTSLNNLTLIARGIAAQQAAQQAARLAATNGAGVPDGLVDGGLKVDTDSLTKGWLNATAPTQTTADGKTSVVIQQTAEKAILNWETFNVGKNTILSFLQLPHWAVLNRVNDPLARPSQIQGQIKGDGTVMVVNRNGIIFSGSSQIDTRNLVAAAANISDSQFTTGLYGANQTTASFTDANGKLIVEAGAQIATRNPGSVTQGGGYVLLLGTEVSNAGQITTNRGQAELAAGDSFIIRKGVGTDGNTISTTRGNEIAPQFNQGSSAGKVSNSGLIVAREGDVTLAGRDVQQNGVAVASTTVNTRGTIHLLNSAGDAQGKVTLGAGATTAIVIEDDGVTTALNSQRDALISESAAQDILRANSVAGRFDNLAKLSDRRDQSRIEIVSGGDVEFQGGSTTLATGGQIAVSAVKRSFVADKATLDVSGTVGVNLAMDVNNIKINVQGNELRDAPGNRDLGSLLNGNLWIDTRQLIYVPAGTGGYASDRWYTAGGLLEVGGYLGNQGHRAGEWAAQGGSIMLGGAEVITQAGSSVNLSGGTLNVQTGYLNQSWLKGADGQLYNASTASANMMYTGVYKGFEDEHVRWGKNATAYYYNPLIGPQRLLQNGYTVGRDAGRLIINAPTAVIEGNIVADVYNGPQQTAVRSVATSDGYKLSQSSAARAALLALGNYSAIGRTDLFNTDVRIGEIAQTTLGMGAGDALDPARNGTVWLDSKQLSAQALGGLDLGTRGAIVIDRALTLADGGQLNLTGANIDIRADVAIHGGSLRAGNLFLSGVAGSTTQVLTQGGASLIALRDGATLDLRGRQSSAVTSDGNTSAYVDGGSVALESANDVSIERGSVIDVSSGAAILVKGKQKGGKGGNVSLIADSAASGASNGGALRLDGEVRAYGVSGGGAFKIETGNAVVIGGDPALTPAALNIDASRLQSGFSSIDINGHQGLAVAAGAQLDVAMPVYRFSGSDQAGALLTVWTPPQQQDDVLNQRIVQRAGADLTLRSQRRPNEGGDIAIGAGAVISVDPGRSISLLGGGMSNIVVDGRLNAWGGNIAIGIDSPLATSLQSTSQHAHQRSIWIGDSAVLDVAARAVTATAANGRRYGTVRDGGTIAIGGTLDWEGKGEANASDIAVIIRSGALLDASGSSAVLDFPAAGKMNQVNVASNGGSIILKSAHSLYLDGTLRARAGGAGAAGGTLAIALERLAFASNAPPDDAVRAQREFIFSQTQQGSGLSPTLQPGQTDPALVYGTGRLGVDQVVNGGFGNLSLLVDGALSFAGDVNLTTSQSMRLYAGSYGLAETAAANSQVRLASSYLRLGAATRTAKDFEVMYGVTWRNGASTRSSDAVFTATADLIDVRDRVGFGAHGQIRQQNNSLVDVDQRGFDTVDLVSRGDLRLLGGTAGLGLSGSLTTELATTGNMRITAAQIYPATNASAQIMAGYDTGRVLDIRRYGGTNAAAPFSVFGSLMLGADTVRQGGVVRAPLGSITLGTDGRGASTAHASLVDLLPGSLTSVSGAGLFMPYGGTIDGVTYDYAGKPIALRALGTSGITMSADSVVGHGGSVLDLSGGGELTGAGFISGRGGSVDILRTPLVNANPTSGFSKSGNAVYAIVPGSGATYAPVAAEAGAADPMIGRQITIDSDVAGLKAGTYTLMPSTYALLPGAFRVEVGTALTPGGGVVATGNGSYVASGYLGVANTAIRSSLPNQLVLTPADAVRKQSTYNETDYNAFVVADAARRGGMRGEVSDDARGLVLDFGYVRLKPGVRMLQFDGTALFNPKAGSGGFGGTLSAKAYNLEVLADGAMPSAGFTGASLYASDLNSFNPARMILGGSLELQYGDNFATFKGDAASLVVRSGAQLSAPEVFMVTGSASGGITVEQGASVSTLGRGAAAYDSSNGVVFSAGAASVLGLSNGWINLLPTNVPGSSGGAIDVGACNGGACSGAAALYSEGTLAIATNKALTIAENARYGSRNLLLAVSSLNMGSDAALGNAAANGMLPAGLSLNQGVLNRLLAGNAGVGVPAVESLIFNVRESVNMYGSVDLDTRNPVSGKSSIQRLVVGTPAIYGYGSATDKANILTEEFVWTGSTSSQVVTGTGNGSGQYTPDLPGAAIGSLLGDGTLNISAQRIVFGNGPNSQPLAGVSADRLALGFGAVNFNAGERVTANGTGTLKVYHQQGAYVAGQGYQYTGGDLNIVAPMVTGEAGSVNRVTAGGAIALSAPTGVSTAANNDALGAELQLNGRSISVNTAVALHSGKLSLNAADDLTLGADAHIDLSGRAIRFFEQTRYSWGGDLLLNSTNGNIVQGAGSIIDLSAQNNRGGTLKATALGAVAGHVDLAGSIRGAASGRYDAGGTIVPYDAAEVTVRAQTLNDFAGLNARLNSGDVFGARRFQIKQGDLVIGDEVKARQVEVTVDGGKLTVNGRIDASGFQVGAIRLSARDDLTVNGVLDAHATGLRVDSYGKIIDSANRAIVDLTTQAGMLTLGANAAVDLRAGTATAQGNDGAARGTFSLNAPRLGGSAGGAGAGANDVAVTVNGAPLINGAKTIAVNAFRSYDDAPLAPLPDISGNTPQLVTQAYLDGIDVDSQAYINAALANTNLAGRLAGLGSYHLRPGVEIVSNKITNPGGDLTVAGDLDLSGYRYGPGANRLDPNLRGYGEPGVLVLRAGGNINVYGSINDGFAPPPATPDDKGWYLTEGRNAAGRGETPFGGDIVIPVDGIVLEAGTLFPKNATLNYDVPVAGAILPGGTVLPVDVTLNGSHTLAAGTVLGANVYNADGSVALAAGTVLGSNVVLSSGMKLGAGNVLRSDADVAALTWPKGVALPVDMTASSSVALARGALIPAMTKVELLNDEPVSLRPANGGVQGRNWAVAPMLGQGSSSWGLQLTAGADLGSADRRAVLPTSKGSVVLADTHAMTKVEVSLGGTGLVWSDAAADSGLEPGAPVDQLYIDLGVCDPAGGGLCAIDPKRISYVWGVDGTKWDPSFVVGQPVDPLFMDYCSYSPNSCSQFINPVKDVTAYTVQSPMFSVIRTGSADLGINAARDLLMQSPFGVYTAGTRSAALTNGGGADPYNQPRSLKNGSPIGIPAGDYSDALASYQAWYPEQGGNLSVNVGGDVTGDTWGAFKGVKRSQTPSASVGNWLWRQGTGSTASGTEAIPTAWWINFGAYVPSIDVDSTDPYLVGFTGFGTLGGGNLSIDAGGNAGILTRRGDVTGVASPRSQALVAAVGSTGRVGADGTLTLTGGGDLRIRVGGAVNANTSVSQYGNSGASIQNQDINGALINLRGMTSLTAGAIGGIQPRYRQLQAQVAGADGDAADTRSIDAFTSTIALSGSGLTLMPGDSAVYLDTLGDLVLATAADPGRVFSTNTTAFTAAGNRYAGGGQSWFSLWTPRTAVNLFAAGGNLTPGTDVANQGSSIGNSNPGDIVVVYPSILRATAATGSIYYGYSAAPVSNSTPTTKSLVLAPSAKGALEFLAGNSLFGGAYPISMSGSDAPLPTPFNPAFAGFAANGALIAGSSNLSLNGTLSQDGGYSGKPSLGAANSFPLFAFGPDTIGSTALHLGDPSAALFYAVNGDVVGLSNGNVQTYTPYTERTIPVWYRSATAARVLAGRDIVNANGLFVHNNSTDISLVQAGRDILYANLQVAGPGTLEVSAGRNLLQEGKASIVSIGALVQGDSRPGADIAMMAGMGAGGLDFSAIAKRYLNPANLADANTALASQSGKVVKTYNAELGVWLKDRYGFQGNQADALAYFNALAPEQQRVFLRSVYYAELREGGREYNNQESRRYGSFLRSRDMIATLFPDRDAASNEIRRSGDITMFGNAGVHTNFGGDIQMMAPGGQIVVGVQGEAPQASAGVVTQGQGNIQLFSEKSLLLGLSRVMTTFGGDIFAWSEQGDINAGRGSKTTVLYTPPKRVYDQWGNTALSPQAPSSGAGIATLSPVPEAKAGDVDLIAPLGKIDAGEAGIRVSGNINIFALEVVNATNIQVKGEAAGIPTVAAVNVGALSNASAAASSAAAAAQDTVQRARNEARQALPSIFTVRVLGFGNDGGVGDAASPTSSNGVKPGYDQNSFVQIAGHGDEIKPELMSRLTEAEKRKLRQDW
ncbi:filamentous hemagglutinin N-terminal domain-containing protein [Herbaspirillum lusitanum]|uniref:filamentous hemagglutinin family protein n=1 Tax=Herbaspirillum lusitanum TaxID=213312 RepID=UPI00223823EF|nr:filamentous hemagglutinin family protein [Herbaspirillum lusitanum]MCW5298901.1 filamentous hemagglutinin N-terminal domain-containing protein [Herbaspirillum lusitanum]